MNKQVLESKRELTPFFFENKLYEFSQKKLDAFNRQLMKKMTEDSPEAKYTIGKVLMSLEYLEKIQDVNLDMNLEDLVIVAKKKSKMIKILNLIFFALLTICFFVSGYILMNEFLLVPKP